MVQLITDFIHAANLKLVDSLPIIGKTFELCQLVGENKLVEYQSNGNSSIVLTDKHGLFTAWTREGAASTESLKELLYDMMKEIETFIKKSAPGGLYGEWAKKEEKKIKEKMLQSDN
jgi:hypothetical protein